MAESFQKYEGLGNDFIVVDADDESYIAPARAASLCDRRFGVGGDGVLLVLPSRVPGCDARMRVLNSDGSLSEMCGNGVRCVALHVGRARRLAKVRVDTDAGPCVCDVEDTGSHALVTVDMGVVRDVGTQTLDVDGVPFTLRLADSGNPHAVLFGSFERAEIERLGSRLSKHASFPRGTNVEFARVGVDAIDLVVWERGAGITMACGTGACATAVVACADGKAPRDVPLTVRLPGGPLQITVHGTGRVTMRGPARHVFSGVASSTLSM